MKKVAWITGASSGIGEEICKQLANKDFLIVLSARSEEKLFAVKNGLKNSNEHLILPLDLENIHNESELVEKVVQKFGKIDYLFNCGGLSQRAEAAETSIEVDRKIMEINYFGTV
ncbi:MAG: SDR family NAD(P)-dependent oxidoreductase, partial [Fluviicola sp.]